MVSARRFFGPRPSFLPKHTCGPKHTPELLYGFPQRVVFVYWIGIQRDLHSKAMRMYPRPTKNLHLPKNSAASNSYVYLISIFAKPNRAPQTSSLGPSSRVKHRASSKLSMFFAATPALEPPTCPSSALLEFEASTRCTPHGEYARLFFTSPNTFEKEKPAKRGAVPTTMGPVPTTTQPVPVA